MATPYHFGWIRSPHDERDIHFSASPHVLASLPSLSDLRNLWGGKPVYDQGQLGSCGPNAAGGDLIAAYLPKGQDIHPSRLFVYWVTRYLMGTVNQDSGVDNRTLFKALAQFGWADESLWPYVISQFTKKPPQAAFDQAAARKLKLYLRVAQAADQMKGCLVNDPFVFGFTCYESLMSDATAKTGVIPDPKPGEKVIGGHDVVLCGYDDNRQMFRLRNSWGPDWGEQGYGWISYNYALDAQKAGDFWTVRYDTPDPPPQPPPPPGPNPPPNPPPPAPGPVIDWSALWPIIKPLVCAGWHTFKPQIITMIDKLPAPWPIAGKLVEGELDALCP